MKINNIKKIIFILTIIIFISGCSNKDEYGVDLNKYKTNGLNVTSCKREATTENGETASLTYKAYSDDKGYLKVLFSTEKIKSTDRNVLEQYEEAYKKVSSVYDDIDYYDTVVKKTNKDVVVKFYINYGKVDIDKVMDIEGEEDNVTVKNGKIKISDWKKFVKKYGGVICE